MKQSDYALKRGSLPFLILIFIIIPTGFLTGCEKRTTPELDKVEAMMKDKPDSALYHIYNINPENFNEAQYARYSLLKSQALYRNGIELTADSIIRPAVEYYSGHGSDYEKMLMHYYYGEIFSCGGMYDEAIGELLTAAEYGKKTTDDFYYPRILVCQAIAYNAAMNAMDGFKPLQEAEDIFRRTGDKEGLYYAIFEKAQAYENTLQRDSAEIIYKELLESDDSVAVAKRLYTQYGYGVCLSKDSLYKEALEMLKPYYSANTGNISNSLYSLLGELYARTGDTKMAKAMIDSVHPSNLSDSVEYYYSLLIYYDYLGDQQKHLAYFDSATIAATRIISKEYDFPAVKNQRDLTQKYLKQKTEESDQRRQMAVILSALGVIVITTLFIIIYRQRKKTRELRGQIRRKLSEYSSELKSLQEDLAEIEIGINEKKYLFMGLKQAYKRIDRICSGMLKSSSDSLNYRIMASELEDVVTKLKNKNSKEEFFKIVNIEYDGVIDKLKDDFGFNDEELSILAWSACGFSYITIGMLLGKTPNSIASKRTRLKNRIMSTESPNSELYHQIYGKREVHDEDENEK